MRTKKPKQPKAPRKITVGFEKHSSDPSAIVNGKFVAPLGSYVYLWRLRSGHKPSWHTCQVNKVEEKHVSLWDDTLGQWFFFDPTAATVPDVRFIP